MSCMSYIYDIYTYTCTYVHQKYTCIYSIYIYFTPSWELYNYTCVIRQLPISFFFCKGGSCFFPGGWHATYRLLYHESLNLKTPCHGNKATVVSLMPGIILICVPRKWFLFCLGYLDQAGGMLRWDFLQVQVLYWVPPYSTLYEGFSLRSM